MKRRPQFGTGSRAVLGTPHGPTVSHHGWDWVVAHKTLMEIIGVLLGAFVIFATLALLQSTPRVSVAPAPLNALEVYRSQHAYDAIEDARALRLVNPRPVADRRYDAIEDLRAERLLLQGDRRYDTIEDLRAARLITPLPIADHRYDAIEELRANRDLGR